MDQKPLTARDLADLAKLHQLLMRPSGEASGNSVIEEYTIRADEVLAQSDAEVVSCLAEADPVMVGRLLSGFDAVATYHQLRARRFVDALRRLQAAAGIEVV